jgi:hypothetical protein
MKNVLLSGNACTDCPLVPLEVAGRRRKVIEATTGFPSTTARISSRNRHARRAFRREAAGRRGCFNEGRTLSKISIARTAYRKT